MWRIVRMLKALRCPFGHFLDTRTKEHIGIGMSANDENVTNPSLWQGQNLLGIALMEVREILRNE